MLTNWNKSRFSSPARASATSRSVLWTPPVNWLKANVDASIGTSLGFWVLVVWLGTPILLLWLVEFEGPQGFSMQKLQK